MKKLSIPVLAASLVSASVASAATPPSTAFAREAAPVEDGSEIGSSLAIIGAIVVAVGVLFFVILDDDDDDDPVSA